MIKAFNVPANLLDKVKELLKDDVFARNGYELRNAEGLGLSGKEFYLYVDGNDEFWKKAQPMVDALKLEPLKGKKFKEVSAKFQEQLNSTGFGVGALFLG